MIVNIPPETLLIWAKLVKECLLERAQLGIKQSWIEVDAFGIALDYVNKHGDLDKKKSG